MQSRSYAADLHPRLHVHPSAAADRLKRELLDSGPAPAAEAALLAKIGRVLLADVAGPGGQVPVVVLRGGLALLDPWRERHGAGPTGVLAPARSRHELAPTIAYGSVPRVAGAEYVLLDVLLASGRTMHACLDALSGADGRVTVVAPFVSTAGRDAILAAHPDVRIHCIWHEEQVDATGRMVGPGFDVGDCVLGHRGPYLSWGAA
jgi:uracil phosphoribosyltransferase